MPGSVPGIRVECRMDSVNFLIVGAGYVGRALGLQLQRLGSVVGVVSRESSARTLQDAGLTARVCDLDAVDAPCSHPADRVIYLVPPPASGSTDPRLAQWLARMARPRRFVYLSTTAVYGTTGGGTVDEASPTAPSSARGQRRLDAETQVRRAADAQGFEWTILRVPGIYGPERLPLERLRRGEPVLADEDAGLTNRIHVEDLVTALRLTATHPAAAGRIYNVSDGAPCSTSAHFRRVARWAGLPEPPTVRRQAAEGLLSPAFLAYLDESRALDSRRIERELGFRARYANPDEGIRASLSAQTGRADRS
jgi:nucleoside-diphosphate-sugar epimerase